MANVALAESAGIELENGIKTDIYGQTSAPSIWAIGDCASFPYKGGRIRLESIQNAIDQAETVAENILGQQKPYQPVPTFWSEQYKTMIQIAGIRTEGDETITRPNIRTNKEAEILLHLQPTLQPLSGFTGDRNSAQLKRLPMPKVFCPPAAF